MKFKLKMEDVSSTQLVNRISEIIGAPTAVTKDREDIFKLGNFEIEFETDCQETVTMIKEGTTQLKEFMPLITEMMEKLADHEMERLKMQQGTNQETNQLRDKLCSMEIDYNQLHDKFEAIRQDRDNWKDRYEILDRSVSEK